MGLCVCHRVCECVCLHLCERACVCGCVFGCGWAVMCVRAKGFSSFRRIVIDGHDHSVVTVMDFSFVECIPGKLGLKESEDRTINIMF